MTDHAEFIGLYRVCYFAGPPSSYRLYNTRKRKWTELTLEQYTEILEQKSVEACRVVDQS